MTLLAEGEGSDREFACVHGCGERVTAATFGAHESTCARWRVPCDICGMAVPTGMLEHHKEVAGIHCTDFRDQGGCPAGDLLERGVNVFFSVSTLGSTRIRAV